MSSDEISMSTDLGDLTCKVILQSRRQSVVHIDLDGHQQQVSHSKNWNSIHRCKAEKAGLLPGILALSCATAALQGKAQGFGQRGLGRDLAEINLQMHHRLRDLRTDPGNEAVSPH